MNINNTVPIDFRDPQYDGLLSRLQGNILKGHGRESTMSIFIWFRGGRVEKARAWLREFAATKVTCMKKQLRETEVFKRNHIPGGLFAGVYITAKGYKYFGHELDGFDDVPFKNGMAQSDLNDPPTARWEAGLRGNANNEIHAMILLGDHDEERICKAAKEITEAVESLGKVLTVEYGRAIKNESGDGIEHFGYVDGVSQPLFFTDEINAYKNNSFGILDFDPFAPLSQVLVPDPLAGTTDAFGSYFVFRKLEQDVQGFKKAEQELGKELEKIAKAKHVDFDPERAGAMLVGRFEDGTPVVLSETDGMIGSGTANNFNYAKDTDGLKCPFHAHVRKSNPRTNGKIDEHTMARRGITYGSRQVNPAFEQSFAQMPTGGVGLLFMSFQASIERQFQFIQRGWANNTNFPVPNTGIDAIIGQVPAGAAKTSHGKYAVDYGKPPLSGPFDFKLFVTMKGGEYFFAPSVPFLTEKV
ncbi:MAG: Dyp-type peroxidase [Cytophagales bacterium]|jgi:Dyp-type peroxidase family|nr:Dyp-type peroxidase [Cytophagales bacterium]